MTYRYFLRKAGPGWLALGIFLLLCAFSVQSGAEEDLSSPLEKSAYRHLTDAAQRSRYLKRLCAYPSTGISVRQRILGHSVEQRPIEAVLVQSSRSKKEKLRVMLLAAQHGSEISGCEALLILAGDWVSGRSRPAWLEGMQLLIIPAVNPDGIENRKRVNAQGINLSTDFGLLAAPESAAVNTALMDFKPHVVLDIHESALLKKKSLGAEGWLTDFEAQFEYANNPNVDDTLQQFSRDVLLPRILEKVRGHGLRAERYIGEITRTDQVITHGGLSAQTFRNKAGLLGAASFLVENRLDVSTGTYPTPRNIRQRVRKQMLCISAFLDACSAYSKQLIAVSENARPACATAGTVWLQPAYVEEPAEPCIDIPLRRIDTGELVVHRFQYRKNIVRGPAAALPARYLFVSQTDFFAGWLEKQGIPSAACHSGKHTDCIEAKVQAMNGCLLPLYLEPDSSSSILGRLPFKADIEHAQTE